MGWRARDKEPAGMQVKELPSLPPLLPFFLKPQVCQIWIKGTSRYASQRYSGERWSPRHIDASQGATITATVAPVLCETSGLSNLDQGTSRYKQRCRIYEMQVKNGSSLFISKPFSLGFHNRLRFSQASYVFVNTSTGVLPCFCEYLNGSIRVPLGLWIRVQQWHTKT